MLPRSPTALLANDLVAHHLATHAPELLEVVAAHGECPPMFTRVLDRSRLHVFIEAFEYEKVCNVLSPCADSLAGDELRQLTHLLKLLDDGALRDAIENKDSKAAKRAFARLRCWYKNDAHPHMRNFALAIAVGSVEHLTPMWKQPDQPSQDGSQGAAVVGSTVTNENRHAVLHEVLDRVLDRVPELLEATQRYSTLPDLAEKLRELEQLREATRSYEKLAEKLRELEQRAERAMAQAEEAQAGEAAARAGAVAATENLGAAELTLAQRDRELADLRMQLPRGLSCTADDGPSSSSSEIAIWKSKRAHDDEGDQAATRRQRTEITEIASDSWAAGVGVRAPGECH